MYDCPNCGEPIDEEAVFCPHCGSDAETGWKPDADYYGLELPEDDEVELDRALPPTEDWKYRARIMISPALIVLCFILFVSVGYNYYGRGVLFPSIYLMAMTLLGQRGLHKSSRPPPREA